MTPPLSLLDLPLAAFIGLPGWAEMAVILLIILLLFGNKIPNIARNLGRSMIEFKRGIRGSGDDDDDEEPERLEGGSSKRIEAGRREASGAGAHQGSEARDS